MATHRNRKILRAIDLVIALSETKEPVRLRNFVSDNNKEMSPNDVLRFVLLAPYKYEGEARPGRVYWIRATTGVPTELDSSHWEDRACIRFHSDSSQARTKDKRVAEMWTRLAITPPAYMTKK